MGDGDQAELTDARHIEVSLVDPYAFAILFERHAGSVHRYLIKRVGLDNAEDLLGETFVTAFRARSSYDLSRSDARPWLFGIATNHARHFWRSEVRRQSRDTAGMTGATQHDHSDEATARAFFSSQEGAVAQALAQLDDAHLDVLLLVAGPGFTYEEVSASLGIPVGTVRSRMSRTRRRLRELLGGSEHYLEGPPPAEGASASPKGNQ
ncbi:MAG TPA: RNA polymerase sigma factor [Acidimicrobiales bacterium]|jgi:RNA polymerase sigma-70 factor (ECF subfamily)